MRFGKPLDFSRYAGMENDRYILRSITDEIMYEIMRLSGQEYVDLYASKAKELDKEKAKQAAAEQAERERPSEAGTATAGAEGVLSTRRGPPAPAPRADSALAVEDRLYSALALVRVVVTINMVGLNAYRRDNFDHPDRRAWRSSLALVVWTGAAIWLYHDRARRTSVLLVADLAIALAAMAVTPGVKGADFNATIPGFWVMGALLAWAIHWHWKGGLVAAVLLVGRRPAAALGGRPGQLRQRLPGADRRPDRRLHVRVAAADGARARRRRARGRGRRGAHPARARRARRRAPGAGA